MDCRVYSSCGTGGNDSAQEHILVHCRNQNNCAIIKWLWLWAALWFPAGTRMILLAPCQDHPVPCALGTGALSFRVQWPMREAAHHHIHSIKMWNTWIPYIFRCIHKIVKRNCELHHTCPAVWLSAWYILAPTGRIFVKFDIWVFFKNLLTKFKFH